MPGILVMELATEGDLLMPPEAPVGLFMAWHLTASWHCRRCKGSSSTSQMQADIAESAAISAGCPLKQLIVL